MNFAAGLGIFAMIVGGILLLFVSFLLGLVLLALGAVATTVSLRRSRRSQIQQPQSSSGTTLSSESPNIEGEIEKLEAELHGLLLSRSPLGKRNEQDEKIETLDARIKELKATAASTKPMVDASTPMQQGNHRKGTSEPSRPDGITILSVLWLLSAPIAMSLAVYGYGQDLTTTQTVNQISYYLNSQQIELNSTQFAAYNWARLNVNMDELFQTIIFLLGFIQLFVAYGLFRGRSWSFKLTVGFWSAALMTNVAYTIFLASAPVALGLTTPIAVDGVVWDVIIMVLVVSYLRKPHVRAYLTKDERPISVPLLNGAN